MSDVQKVFSIVSEKSVQTSDAKPGKFAVGDPVQLSSGGVVMTVRKCAKGVVICDWHTEAGELSSAEFPAAMLHPAELLVDVEIEQDES
jgi:uncharacterized protein YodC (DUF2158 family)